MISVSFYNSNISKEVVTAQKRVFDYFGYKEHLQVHTSLPHGRAIDQWLQNNPWTEVAIFDIDCIPLNRFVLRESFRIIERGDTLYGVAQSANHLSNELYVGAPFICLNRDLWNDLNKPSFQETERDDVAGRLSRAAQRKGKIIAQLWPTHVEIEKWDLGNTGVKFGYGTTYQDSVYHAFESRFNHESSSRFIDKCNLITHAN